VLAGAPIDAHAEKAGIAFLAANTPLGVFRELVRLGEGRVLGRHALVVWQQTSVTLDEIYASLQLADAADAQVHTALIARFRNWHACAVDLPGTYYLQVVEQLFQNNALAEGRFVSLGHRIDLADVHVPIFMLAARDDQLVGTRQLFATETLVTTPPSQLAQLVAPCTHLGLFMGERTLTEIWPNITRWMIADETEHAPRSERAQRPH
jgi:poly-beta-hydroxyalkanoate depolymerase